MREGLFCLILVLLGASTAYLAHRRSKAALFFGGMAFWMVLYKTAQGL
jgi:lipopolysaccharide export LptBFGC system permease protein LptF